VTAARSPFFLVVVERGARCPDELVFDDGAHATPVAQDADETERELSWRVARHVAALRSSGSDVAGAFLILGSRSDSMLFEHRVALATSLAELLVDTPGARLVLTSSRATQQHELFEIAGSLLAGRDLPSPEIVVVPGAWW